MASSISQTILDNFSSLTCESHPPPISVPQSLLLQNKDLACYLVFKIFTHKQLQLQELEQSLAAAWGCRHSPPRISEYHGNNVFLAKFDKKSDTHHIVEGAPWLLDGDLISVQRCRARTLPSAYPFHASPFWVQLHGLPIDFLTAEVAVLLGNHLGSVSASPSLLEQLFIRVRVEIDVCKPLVGSLPVSLSASETITVQIKYENLPTYCRFCGMIGHDGEADQCRSREDLKAAIVDCNLPDESRALLRSQLTQPMYEHSLRALPVCPPKITEITEEDTEEIQASAPVNQVTRDERGERSPESSDIEEVHGAEIVSLFRKMLPCSRPAVDDCVTLNQIVQTKLILKLLQMEDPKKRSKALKTALAMPGVSSATISEDRLVVVGVKADAVRLVVMLRKRLCIAEIVSVGRVAPVARPQLFVDIRQYTDFVRWRPDEDGS